MKDMVTEGGLPALGLSGDEAAALLEIFGGRPPETAKVIQGLAEGKSIGEALGLPACATDLIYAQAYAQFNAGHPEKAHPLFAALCVLDGQLFDHWLGLGICLRHRGETVQARVAFETARKLAPEAAAPAFHLAHLMMELGERGQARTLLLQYRDAPRGPEKAALAEAAGRMMAVLEMS